MRLLHINPQTRSIEEIELKIEANTFYTFFGSILIDELPIINSHTVYTDANALSEKKTPFFIGEQIVMGEALVLGRNGLEEVDATITKEQLASVISYEVSDFYEKALTLLSQTDENLYKVFRIPHNGEEMDLNITWVLYFFNIADERTKEYFLNELEKAIGDKTVAPFMEKMATAALKAAS